MGDQICAECGMVCTPGEFHPYAACLMFKACHDGDTVRANLDFVVGRAALAARQDAQCPCPACKVTPHLSSCAVHNAPAYPVGQCDCQAIDVAGALERNRAAIIADTVRAMSKSYEKDGMPTSFSSGFDLAAEEIACRIRTEEWTLAPAQPVPQAVSQGSGQGEKL